MRYYCPQTGIRYFYLLEAGVFEMDNSLWILSSWKEMKADLISRGRKWNLKHDESFSFFFFSNAASISLSIL